MSQALLSRPCFFPPFSCAFLSAFSGPILPHFPSLLPIPLSSPHQGSFFDAGYRFVSAWAIMTFLDPILILLIDLCYERWRGDGTTAIGDAFKLYWHFERSDDGGLPGAFLTIFLYAVLMLIAGVCAYLYFLRVHMDGRIVDLYQRLSAKEETFILPYDHEVSNRELAFVVRKAERWRGKYGERRKVAVYDFVWQAEATDGAEHTGKGPSGKGGSTELRPEVTTHVSVHTLYLDGLREIHRQFLRLPDGAIVEVFGDFAGRLDRRVRKTLTAANVDVSELSREATAFINSQFHSIGSLSSGTLLGRGVAE